MEGKTPTCTNVYRMTFNHSLSYHHNYTRGIVYISIVTYTSRAKRSEPPAHMDQRCFVDFLLYVSVSLSFLLIISSVRWFSPVFGSSATDHVFVLMSSCSVEHMQNALRRSSCCLYSLCIFPVFLFSFSYPSVYQKKKLFLLIFLTLNATDYFSINK